MQFSKLVTACAFLASVAMIAAPASASGAEDHAAIEKAVFDYFHGQGTADLDRLNRAFAADHVTMVGVRQADDGETNTAWKNMNEVLSNWAANENPPGSERDGEILDMHIVDGRLATVVFRYTDRFYDGLVLAKVNGEWKIIAKTFIQQ